MNLLLIISGIASVLSTLICSYQGIKRSPDLRTGLVWLAYSYALLAWASGVVGIARTDNATIAMNAWKYAFGVGVIWMSPIFYHLIARTEVWSAKRSVMIHYGIGTIFTILLLSDGLFDGVRWVFDSLFYCKPSSFFFLFFIWWIGLDLYTHLRLLKGYAVMDPHKRRKVRRIIFSTIFAYLGGGSCFLPIFNIDLIPILNFLMIYYPWLIMSAIFPARIWQDDIIILLRELGGFTKKKPNIENIRKRLLILLTDELRQQPFK